MTRRRALMAGAVAIAASLAPLAPAAAASDDAAVRRCVRDNLPRYSAPDRALVSQYFDLDQACRAALAGDGQSQIWITPLGSTTTSRPGGSTAAPSAGATTPTTPTARPPTPQPPKRPRPGRTPTPRADSASAAVARALDEAQRGSSVPGAGVDVMGAPAWLLALLGGAAAAVAAAAGRRAWRRGR